MALIMASETLAPLTPLWHWLVIIGSVAAFAGIGALLNLYQKRRAAARAAAAVGNKQLFQKKILPHQIKSLTLRRN